MERWTKERKSEHEDQMGACVYKKERQQKELKEIGSADNQ